jgi:hypothetical protein
MRQRSDLPSSLDRQGETRALLRARQAAREIAVRTGTPLVIYRDGKIELIKAAAMPAPVATVSELADNAGP